MIRDKNVEWLEARLYIPVTHFTTFTDIVDATDASENTSIQGAAAGNPELEELSTFGIAVGSIAAAGDTFTHLMMVPYDLDRSKQIRFRVWWTQTSTTATDSVDWILTYQAITEESTVLAAPTTALNTVIPLGDLSSGTAFHAQATDFGIINKNTLAAATAMLGLQVEADAIGTFSADEVKFLGLEMRYTPRRCAGPEKNLRAGRRLATASPLGATLHATQEG
jgi:hypothetical protein